MNASSFLKKYPEALLVTLAIIFLVIIVGSFLWGVGDVFTEVNRSIGEPPPGNEPAIYDLHAAAVLNLPSSTSTSAVAPVSIPATSTETSTATSSTE